MTLAAALLVSLVLSGSAAPLDAPPEPPMVTITGRVTDFAGAPLAGADVALLTHQFAEQAKTTTDRDGRYSLEVVRGARGHLFACRDYQKQNLEFWAWNLEADHDLVIDARVHRLELYAMNAFVPQGGTPSWLVYFRPMSLTRATEFLANPESGGGVVDIAPALVAGEVSATVDGVAAPVLEISRVLEAGGSDTGGRPLVAYLIQIAAPEGGPGSATRKICVELHDSELEESGEGCVFWKPAAAPPGERER